MVDVCLTKVKEMVCLSDEGTIQCTVKAMISNCSKKTAILQLYPDKTVSSVFTEICSEFNCDSNVIELALQNNGCSDLIILNLFKDKTLREAGVRFDTTSRTLIIITQLKTKNMTLYVQGNSYEDDLLLGASASPTAAEGVTNTMDPPPALMSVDFYNSSQAHSSRDNRASYEPCNYVGLVNQAMTCYLNSLLQALYMTPEFRNALYNWEFDGKNPVMSIPFQLQRLFLNLQTSPKSAVETTDLTYSFGWKIQQAWEQHDIQELCRVMLDALEQKFKDTKQAHLINDLYEGKMLDYVKCLECGTEKSREDTFQDIPLPVRPFLRSAYNSVEEALRAFVEPETLDEDNQYFCVKCNKKCNAHKGLKFIKFPYLLTLHLKRFDFDFQNMYRIKLNDKVVFPEILNLNSFIVDSNNVLSAEVLKERETLVKCDDCSTTDSGSALDDESCQGTDILSTANGPEDTCPDDDEGIDVSSGNHHENEKNRLQEPTGPYNYELFSIMIHSGSASGGHYYAYIKDFSKNQWFCFNDQSVTRVTEDDIQKSYGGGSQRGYYSGAYTPSTNAYMLMYRQIDPSRNCQALTTEEFPEHIKQLLHDMREKEETDRIMKEKENNTFKIKIYCHVPGQDSVSEERFFVFSDTPLSEATTDAYEKFKLKDIVQLDDCRLVAYNKSMDAIEHSFEDTEAYFCDITKKCTEFLLEIKKPGDVFEEYEPGGVMIKVYHIVNLKESEVVGPTPMWITHAYTYAELVARIALLYKLNTVHIVRENNNEPPEYLEVSDEKHVTFSSRCKNIKLYVSELTNIEEEEEEAGNTKPFATTKLASVIEEFVHRITFDVIFPENDAATLEKLSIPTLQEYNQYERDRDQSNSEDSSLSDSDRTLVGDAPGDNLCILSSSSNSPIDQHMNPTEPFEDTTNHKTTTQMNWDDEEYDDVGINEVEEQKKFYRLSAKRMRTPDSHSCRINTDKRNTIGDVKSTLKGFLNIPCEYFKIYRQYPNQDVEWSSLSDTLGSVKNGDRLIVKLGRVLKKNEVSAKVHLLQLNNPEPIKFWFEWIIAKDQSVASVKKEILLQAKKQHMIDIPFTSCRLRKKSLKNPGRIYLDDEKFFEDTLVSTNLELLVQVVNTTEKKESDLVLFVRRWHPETLSLSKFEEITIETRTVDEVKKTVCELSGIPLEHVEVTCVKCSFPCDMNILEIHSKLDWNPDVQSLENYPLQIYDDGSTFYYRDKREALKELTIEERKELNQSENKRLGRYCMKTYSPRRERGLKIHVDTSPKKEEEVLLD